MQKLNWKLKTDLERAGLKIVQLLNKDKFQGFFVGGAVRDQILKRLSDNLDIATDALPDEVEKILKKANIYFKQIGKKFGTILAIVKGQKLEITTFRRESKYSDRRHPDQVEFIREYLDDAMRRDFTINTIYFNPVSHELFDPVNGLKDVNNKIVRFVGDPKDRIDEDALRMIRGVRLATVLDFKLEKNTFAAIKTRAKYIQTVSGERIKSELDKILLTSNAEDGIRLLDSVGLLKFVLPQFLELKKVFHNSKKYHLEGSVYDHTLLVLENSKKDLDLLYAALFHDIGKISTGRRIFKDGEWVNTFPGHQPASARIFREFAAKYPFSKQGRDLVDWLILRHDDRLNYRAAKERNRIKYSLNPDFPKLVELWAADSLGNCRILENGKTGTRVSASVVVAKSLLNQIQKRQNLIERFSNGKFIISETKLSPGVRIGEISELMKIKIIDGEIKNLVDAKNFLKKFAKNT